MFSWYLLCIGPMKARTKLKTSISMPAIDVEIWKRHRHTICAHLAGHLSRFANQKIRRVGLRCFNACPSGLERINVYWSQQEYNQLHATAHALRMSVSHLLWLVLQFVLAGGRVADYFSNYAIIVHKWGFNALIFEEKINFILANGRSRDAGSSRWRRPRLR